MAGLGEENADSVLVETATRLGEMLPPEDCGSWTRGRVRDG